MYSIQLTIGDDSLILDYAHGCIISTIDGLTGVTAKLTTVQSSTNLGVAVQKSSVSGQTLTVRGYILDHNVEAKRALLSFLKPAAEGTITVNNLPVDGAGRVTPYRWTEFVVKTTPKITQEKHAKFSFELFQPNPTWRAMDDVRVTVSTDPFSPVTATVDGEAGADFEWYVYAIAPINNLSLIVTTPDLWHGVLAFTNLQKIDPNGVQGTIYIRRENGRLKATIGNTSILKCLALSPYLLTALPPGECEFKGMATNTSGANVECVTMLTYYPSYVGVVLDGI